MSTDFYRKNKVLNSHEASEKLNSETLVFTSGVYDLLHSGHIYFFRKAKELVKETGKLVVVIHDDESVRLHKGEHRPINNLERRLDFLSELESIDYVIGWNGWETISEFAESLKPKYFAVTAKSYEHSQKGQWEGKSWENIASKIGADIVKINLIEGLSSTRFEQILNKLE